MDNPILVAAQIAVKSYKDGRASFDDMIKMLQLCVNATAKINGYEEQYGLPFPKTEEEAVG